MIDRILLILYFSWFALAGTLLFSYDSVKAYYSEIMTFISLFSFFALMWNLLKGRN